MVEHTPGTARGFAVRFGVGEALREGALTIEEAAFFLLETPPDRSAARLLSRLAHHDLFWSTLFQPGMFHAGLSELFLARLLAPTSDAMRG
jgi:hypothetical protein